MGFTVETPPIPKQSYYLRSLETQDYDRAQDGSHSFAVFAQDFIVSILCPQVSFDDPMRRQFIHSHSKDESAREDDFEA